MSLSRYQWFKSADLVFQACIAGFFLWQGFRLQNMEDVLMAGIYTLCWQWISCIVWRLFRREKRRYARRLFEKLTLLLLGAGIITFVYGLVSLREATSGYLLLYIYYMLLLAPLLSTWYLLLTLYELINARHATE